MQHTQRTRLLFSFGGHNRAGDARSLRQAFERFQPHVFVMEDRIGEESRLASIRAGNEWVTRARTDAEERRALATQVLGRTDPNSVAFGKEQLELTLQHPVRVFTLEAYGKGELEQIENTYAVGQLNSTIVLSLLADGNVERAEEVMLTAIEVEAQANHLRDMNIQTHLATLGTDVAVCFPELMEEEDVRILIRYGQAHAVIAAYAQGLGFEVEEERDLKTLSPRTRLLLALMDDRSTSRVARADLVLAAFERLYSCTRANGKPTGIGETTAESMEIFLKIVSRLGGAAGVKRFLVDRKAGRDAEPIEWLSRMHTEIRQLAESVQAPQ